LFLLGWIIQKGIKPKRDAKNKVKLSPLFFVVIIVKAAVFFGGIIVAIYYFKINVIGLLVGMSVLFISLIIQLIIEKNNNNSYNE
jgi:hypothetical protein